MTKNLEELFLTDTSDSGRFIVKSKRTGKTYYVEPIGDPHIELSTRIFSKKSFNSYY